MAGHGQFKRTCVIRQVDVAAARPVEAGQVAEDGRLVEAPFGPISEVILPCSAFRSSKQMAVSPPKRAVRSKLSEEGCHGTSSAENSAHVPSPAHSARTAPGQPAARPRIITAHLAALKTSIRYCSTSWKSFRQADDQQGGQKHAQLAAHAAQHHDCQNNGGFDEGEAFRVIARCVAKRPAPCPRRSVREIMKSAFDAGPVDVRLTGDLIQCKASHARPIGIRRRFFATKLLGNGQSQNYEIRNTMRCVVENLRPKSW